MFSNLKQIIKVLASLAIVQALPQAVSPTASNGLAEVYSECTQPGKFVLTFDDGPDAEVTARALDILKKENIKATFFINGQNYGDIVNNQASRDMVLRAYNEGHSIGSHTFYHKDLFAAMEDGTLDENIVKLSSTIKEIIGHEPAFFRPPNGNGGYTEEYCQRFSIPYDQRTGTVRQYLSKYNMKVIMWNSDTRDWANKGNVEGAIEELNRSIKTPGIDISPATHSFITLIHDVHDYSIDVILPAVITYVRELGYEFVSLSECIGQSAYTDGSDSIVNNIDNNQNLFSGNVTVVTNANAVTTSAGNNIYSTSSVFSIICTLVLIALMRI